MLNSKNSVVIGSGILNANLRECNDIDIMVDTETYKKLKSNNLFSTCHKSDTELQQYNEYEIGTELNMVDINKVYTFKDVFENSIVINGVRYNTLEFLLKIKQIWVDGKTNRDKQEDRNDIKLIKEYLENIKKSP